MIRILVCGAAGRMGTNIIRLAKADPGLTVTGAVEWSGSPALGTGDPVITDDLSSVIGDADVVIDFTNPAASLEHLEAAARSGKPTVIGSTGFSPEQHERIREISRRVPVVLSPNMSIGVNLMFRFAAEIARLLPGYDIEVVELHHNQKKDAPSGTALKLGKVIADALDRDLDETGVCGREGVIGPRKKEEIGIMAVRGGDIVGEHTVYYIGTGERIELTHRAQSRDPLAAGALVAAKWVVQQGPGLYEDMQEVFGLKR